METFLWIVAVNWGTPLLFVIYPVGMLLIFKDFKFEGFHGPLLKFRLVNRGEISDPIEPWHAKLWGDWWGVCLHYCICYRDRPGKWDDAQVARGLLHEGAHGLQQCALGLLFWPAYLGHAFYIFIVQRVKGKPYTKHAYLDCWAERMARKRAGQRVDLSPEDWPRGEGDLWPWW